MEHSVILIEQKKRIALVAHDNKKQDLLEWARFNKVLLANHELFATGTTGKLLEQALGVTVHKLQSGPLGGDQQVGAMIADGSIDFMIFFWDPLSPAPHDTDVKALLRIAVVWNIPVACNRASADFMISSTCMVGEYERLVPDYDRYRERTIEAVTTDKSVEAGMTTDLPVEVGMTTDLPVEAGMTIDRPVEAQVTADLPVEAGEAEDADPGAGAVAAI